MASRAIGSNNQFITFYLACTDQIRNKDSLIQHIINVAGGYRSLDELKSLSPTQRTLTQKVNLKFYETETATRYESRHPLEKFMRLSPEERLVHCVDYIANREQRRVLIIIDEFDRIQNADGFASFIKSHTSQQFKFLLVGVANSIGALLGDHASLMRTVAPIEVGPMDRGESLEVIRRAMNRLKECGAQLDFQSRAAQQVAAYSRGFPWFVHLIGQASLMRAYDRELELVTEEHVKDAMSSLASNKYASTYEDLYKKAVRESSHREIVMRLFASWEERDVPTSQIYPLAHQMGVRNPSLYVKQLQSPECGKILVKPPFQQSGIYGFADAMFKQYVVLRQSWYANVDVRIEAVLSANGAD
jgi:hypothetical protein